MTQLPMTPYEKSQRTRKIAIYAGSAALASFILYGAVPAGYDNLQKSDAGKVAGAAASDKANALGRPSRDDLIVVGSIPPKIKKDGANSQPGLEIKRVQLPSAEAIRASLAVDKKIAGRSDSQARGFETCLPHCETRDPLVSDVRAPQRADLRPPHHFEAEVPQPQPAQSHRSLLKRGGDFLGLVADAPSLTIDKGKQAIATLEGSFPEGR